LRETKQVFDKGLNERLPRDRQTPDRLGKLQNARLTERGATFFASRLKGALEFFNYPEASYNKVKDSVSVEGQINTAGFNRGYLIRFIDSVGLDEDNNLGVDLSAIKNAVSLTDIFNLNIIPKLEFGLTESNHINIGERFVVKTRPTLRFIEEVGVSDNIVIPNRFILRFSESVEVLAYDPECQDS